MLSPGSDNFRTLNRASSSSSSSASLSPPFQTLTPPLPKSMEEVWKDISLASLHDHPSSTHHSHSHFLLQDFLARPFSKDPQPPPPPPPPPSLPAPPATALSLNSVPELHFLAGKGNPQISDPIRANSFFQPSPLTIQNPSCPLSVQFDGLDCSPSLPSFGKKRFPEPEDNSGDRRHKRMIKNRESAARSRARKQAYTNELELEVAHLMEENEKLKRQQQQLYLAAAAQVPKKHSLHRSSTAPF